MNQMTLVTPPAGITIEDYSAIEEAVMETARGRWFLLEYARRQRAAETQRLADAVDRLEDLISAAARAQTSPEPTAAPSPTPAASRLAASDEATAATVAERLSDLVWSMRERGFDEQICVELEKEIALVRTLGASTSSAQVGAPASSRQPPGTASLRPADVEETESPAPVAPTPASGWPAGQRLAVPEALPALRDHEPAEATTGTAGLRPADEPQARTPDVDETNSPEPVATTPAFGGHAGQRPALPEERFAAIALTREQKIAALSRISVMPMQQKLALFC